ncbi:unnamed protein product, partial [Polarella glacialis]
VWKYMFDRDIRRRALVILRAVRAAVPTADLNMEMMIQWEAYLLKFENQQNQPIKAAPKKKVASASFAPSFAEDPEVNIVTAKDEEDEEPRKAESKTRRRISFSNSVSLQMSEKGLLRQPSRASDGLDQDLKKGPEASPEPVAKAEEKKKVSQVVLPELPGPKKEVLKIPREARHFCALLRVHRFNFIRIASAVPEVLAAMTEFTDDE